MFSLSESVAPNSQVKINDETMSGQTLNVPRRKTRNGAFEVSKDHPLFRLAVERSHDGIIIGESNGVITYVNDAILRLTGRKDKKDFLGKHILKFVADRDGERALQLSLNAVSSGQSYIAEFTVTKKDGSELLVELTASPINDKKGLKIGFIDIIRSLEERKKSDEAIRKQATLTDLCPSAIIVKDPEENITFWNKGAEKLYGYTKEEVLGQKLSKLLKPDYSSKTNQEILSELKQGKHWIGEVSHYAKDGARIFVKTDWLATLDKEGNILEIFESNFDITDRKKKEEQALKLAEERYLKAERMATIGQLAGMVGHDLRNPLAGIKNAVYLLRKKQGAFVGETGIQMLNTIDRAVEHADSIVTDLVDYSIDLQLQLEEISSKSLINYVILSMKIPRNIKILEKTDDYVIWMDSNKILRVFVNIVKNAFDAMPHGGQLEITSVRTGGYVDFTFVDTGTGMSEDVMEKIFTPLFTTKAQGMGLGLAICRRFVEGHGGKIKVESTFGKGSKFTISLPVDGRKHN